MEHVCHVDVKRRHVARTEGIVFVFYMSLLCCWVDRKEDGTGYGPKSGKERTEEEDGDDDDGGEVPI